MLYLHYRSIECGHIHIEHCNIVYILYTYKGIDIIFSLYY
jgi:hypothetical protein